LPLDDEHRARREEGLLGVRNILWAVGGGGAAAIAGSFTREDFMNEAFLHMKAAEQVFIEYFMHVFYFNFLSPPLVFVYEGFTFISFINSFYLQSFF
jgi:hypothetical protein